jgi:hypothetical protein
MAASGSCASKVAHDAWATVPKIAGGVAKSMTMALSSATWLLLTLRVQQHEKRAGFRERTLMTGPPAASPWGGVKRVPARVLHGRSNLQKAHVQLLGMHRCERLNVSGQGSVAASKAERLSSERVGNDAGTAINSPTKR